MNTYKVWNVILKGHSTLTMACIKMQQGKKRSKQISSLIYKSVGNKKEPAISIKWKAVQSECIVTTVPSTLSKQHLSNGSDDTQVHNGTNGTVSDHISIVKRIQMIIESQIPVTRKHNFLWLSPP